MPLPDSQREKGEAQVRKIVEAGITTFVCLQVYDCISNGTSHAAPLLVPTPCLLLYLLNSWLGPYMLLTPTVTVYQRQLPLESKDVLCFLSCKSPKNVC